MKTTTIITVECESCNWITDLSVIADPATLPSNGCPKCGNKLIDLSGEEWTHPWDFITEDDKEKNIRHEIERVDGK